jgi:hypothetical protein
VSSSSDQLFTPTGLGSWLSSRQVASTDRPTTVSLFDFLDEASFHDALNEFQSGFSESVQHKDLGSYLRRILNVGKAFKITCPTDVERYATDKAWMYKLIFSLNIWYLPSGIALIFSDIGNTSNEVKKSLDAFCSIFPPTSIHSVSLNIGYRFLALQTFADMTISPPKNLCWLFLLFSIVVYEEMAISRKSVMGLANKKDQTIHTEVNGDVRNLCMLAHEKVPSRDTVKAVKVHCCQYLANYSAPRTSSSNSRPASPMPSLKRRWILILTRIPLLRVVRHSI